ncbi:hypothetical protein [Paenibacillus marinisediminis]
MEPITRNKVELTNYYFSGIEASQIGALKSVVDYYKKPVSSSWIYGMTGMAFLIVHDKDFKKPNAGPPEPQLFKLARNFGLNIEGVHTYAENGMFKDLQEKLWIHAREAINNGYPVFAKNIDIENQTSVIYGYDSVGYYTHSWHGGNGHDHADDVIPWDKLGQSLCPCAYCKRNREMFNHEEKTEGLISLHWAAPIPSVNHLSALKDALKFVIDLNDQGVIHWNNDKYFVGRQAYVEWISALERNNVDKYRFSLTLEPIADARSYARTFLSEIKDLVSGQLSSLIDEAVVVYNKIAEIYKALVQKYPYEQPRELIPDPDRNESIESIKELMLLEDKAYEIIKRMYIELTTIG